MNYSFSANLDEDSESDASPPVANCGAAWRGVRLSPNGSSTSIGSASPAARERMSSLSATQLTIRPSLKMRFRCSSDAPARPASSPLNDHCSSNPVRVPKSIYHLFKLFVVHYFVIYT